MHEEAGLTLVELLIVIALSLLVLTLVAAYSVPGIARESMRSSAYEVLSCLQYARAEAIERNRLCRCEIDSDARTAIVLDTRGTSSMLDDEMLHRATLGSLVVFARPDGGDAIGLERIGSTSRYQAVFDSSGAVSAGLGEVVLFGGSRYGRIALHGAGGTRLTHWDDHTWESGL